MADYIDRQAAIAYAISGRIRTLPTSEDGENWIRTEEVRQSLLNVPSVEVEPVKHGRREWRKEKTIWQTGYYCSGCQAFFGKDYDMVKYFNYCPCCGAKMEGEE